MHLICLKEKVWRHPVVHVYLLCFQLYLGGARIKSLIYIPWYRFSSGHNPGYTLGTRDFSCAVSGLCYARGFGLRPKIRQPFAGTEDSRRFTEDSRHTRKKISGTQGILDKFKEHNT